MDIYHIPGKCIIPGQSTFKYTGGCWSGTMAGIWQDDLDYEESREEKRAFDKLLGLLDDVNFRLPEHRSDWDENQRRLAEQLERCSQV